MGNGFNQHLLLVNKKEHYIKPFVKNSILPKTAVEWSLPSGV